METGWAEEYLVSTYTITAKNMYTSRTGRSCTGKLARQADQCELQEWLCLDIPNMLKCLSNVDKHILASGISVVWNLNQTKSSKFNRPHHLHLLHYHLKVRLLFTSGMRRLVDVVDWNWQPNYLMTNCCLLSNCCFLSLILQPTWAKRPTLWASQPLSAPYTRIG